MSRASNTDHADNSGLGPYIATLTAPGGEFALTEQVINGVPMRVYAHGPRTLGDMVLASAAFGDRPFSIYREERYDYAEHLALVLGLGAALRSEYGLRKGDRVAIAMRNYPEWSPAFWAIQIAGCVAVPLNAWWTGSELDWAVQDSGARLVIADGERAAVLCVDVPVIRVRGTGSSAAREWRDLVASLSTVTAPPEVEIGPEDLATILYTSGTTGRPKGAVHSHRNHITNALNGAALAQALAVKTGLQPPAEPGTLLTYPLFHIAGLNTLYSTVLAGGKLATQYRWDVEEARRLIREENLTGAVGVPTTMAELAEAVIESPAEFTSLARIGMGGAPAPAELVRRITGRIGPQHATNGYGLTETTSAACVNTADDYAAHPDSVGRPVPGAELRIADPVTNAELPEGQIGELWFRGPNVFQGYWNNPEATAAAFTDGWFRSGDLGYLRAGWVHVVDRLKDMVLRGGENVYSVQVEDALHEVPWVREVAVYGIPHPTLGEEVAAAVRTTEGAPRDAEFLRGWVTERVAGFAAPTYVVWYDEPLPCNATGKVLKRQLPRRP